MKQLIGGKVEGYHTHTHRSDNFFFSMLGAAIVGLLWFPVFSITQICVSCPRLSVFKCGLCKLCVRIS